MIVELLWFLLVVVCLVFCGVLYVLFVLMI